MQECVGRGERERKREKEERRVAEGGKGGRERESELLEKREGPQREEEGREDDGRGEGREVQSGGWEHRLQKRTVWGPILALPPHLSHLCNGDTNSTYLLGLL